MAVKRWDGAAWTAFTTGTRRRWDCANWLDLSYGRRWNGSQWIELWGDNEGGAVTGAGTYFVFNDDETVVAFTDGGIDTFNLTNATQGF
jgi:hypothetical protein